MNATKGDYSVSSRILAVGDVVGEEATAWLAERLPALRADHAIDWIIVNAENCTVTGPSPMNGFGLGAAAVDLMPGRRNSSSAWRLTRPAHRRGRDQRSAPCPKVT